MINMTEKRGIDMSEIISVIMPVYNAEKYLEKSISSVLKQSYDNLELIIINDGSTDNSEKICREYMKHDSRVKLISIQNQGVSVARNTGIDIASGKYITFIDSDDWIDEEMFLHMIASIEENDTDFSLCGFEYISENSDNPIIVKNNDSGKGSVYDIKYFLNRIYVKANITFNVWNVIFRREPIQGIRFNEKINIGEDNLFILECLLKCKRGYIEPERYYYYQYRNDSLYHTKEITERDFGALIAVEEQAQILKEHQLDIYLEYRHVLLRDYVNICRTMAETKYKEQKWIKFMKKRIIKELLSGAMFYKNNCLSTTLNAILICINFRLFYVLH